MSEEIKDVLTEIGYKLRDCGKEYRAKPLYRESDNPNVLCIKKSNGVWFDFKTNKFGNLEELVQITLKLKDINEAKDFIKNKFNFTTTKVEKEKIKSQQIFSKENLNQIIPDYKYWNRRGVNSDTLKLLESGVMTDGKMKNRYVFPIFDKMNRLIGAAGRDVTNFSSIKWKLIGEKSLWVYPFKNNNQFIREKKSVFLVESIGDMLALWEAGIKNTLVLFGLTASSKIKQVLMYLSLENIYISLNNDENQTGAGNKAAQKIRRDLLNYFDEEQLHIHLPSSNDFGCMKTSEILEWKKQIKT
tara:strand:- start:1368 stop:2270 length:903 start_codon:yes stop_codon:yes gene_type:complete